MSDKKITEKMRAAGWRECPTDAVRKTWEAKGGRWQWLQWDGIRFSPPGNHNPDPRYEELGLLDVVSAGVWRPVHPSTWDHAAWMWTAATGEVLTPTVEGLHWLNRYGWKAIRVVRCGIVDDPRFGKLFVDEGPNIGWIPVTIVNGTWGGPCLGMPEDVSDE